MFYSHDFLRSPQGEFANLWLAAFYPKKLSRRDWERISVSEKCEEVLAHIVYSRGSLERPLVFSLRLSAHLLFGIASVHHKQYEMLLRSVRALYTMCKTFSKSAAEADKNNLTMEECLQDIQGVSLAIDLPPNVSLLDDHYNYMENLTTSLGKFTSMSMLGEFDKENLPMNAIELQMPSRLRSPDEPNQLVMGPNTVKNINDITLQEDLLEVPSHRAVLLEKFDDDGRSLKMERNLARGGAEMLQQLFPLEQEQNPMPAIQDPILTSFDLSGVPANVLTTEPYVDLEGQCVEKESVSDAIKRVLETEDAIADRQSITRQSEQSSILDDISVIQKPIDAAQYLDANIDVFEVIDRHESESFALTRVVESKEKSSESELLAALQEFVGVPRHESTSDQLKAPVPTNGRPTAKEVTSKFLQNAQVRVSRLQDITNLASHDRGSRVPLGARPIVRNRNRRLLNDARTEISNEAMREIFNNYEDLCKPFAAISINQSARTTAHLLNNPARRMGTVLQDLWTGELSKRFESWAVTEKSGTGQEPTSSAMPSVETIRANANTTAGEAGLKTSLDKSKSPSAGETPRAILGELEKSGMDNISRPNLLLDQSSVMVENNNSTLATIPEVREPSFGAGLISESNMGLPVREENSQLNMQQQKHVHIQSIHTPEDLLRLVKEYIEKNREDVSGENNENEGEKDGWIWFSDLCPFTSKRNIAARLFRLLVNLAKQQLVTVEQCKESFQKTATVSAARSPTLVRLFRPIKIRLC